MSKEQQKFLKFGKINIPMSQVFYLRKFVFAFVNIRPIMPGHVLICPIRCESKFEELTETEAMELWISVKNISENIKKFYHCDSVQISIQEGSDAGQTVDHCHVHIIPIPHNYVPEIIDDSSRKNRTNEEMKKEAEDYKQSFTFN